MNCVPDILSGPKERQIRKKYVNLTPEMKERIKKMIESGYDNKKIANLLNMCKPAVSKYRKIIDEELRTTNESYNNGRNNKAKELSSDIVECALADDSLSMYGIMNHLSERGIVTTIFAIKKALKSKYIWRKLGSKTEVKPNSDFLKSSRQKFFNIISKLDNSELIFIGEKDINLNNKIIFNFSFSAQTDGKNANLGISISCLIAISNSGIIGWIVEDKAIDQARFFSFIKNRILPYIISTSIIFLGDLEKYYVGVEEFTKENECRIERIPLYSPQLNPLKEYFTRLEKLVEIYTTHNTTRIQLKDIVNKILTDDKEHNMLLYYKHMRESITDGINKPAC